MTATKKVTTNGTSGTDGQQCSVSERRGETVYRCTKKAGHEKDPNDWQHECEPREYAQRMPDWKALFEQAVPVLEWVANNPGVPTGLALAEESRRALVRHYIARSGGPGLVKARR